MDCTDRAVQLVLDSAIYYAENQMAFGTLQFVGQLSIVSTLDNLDCLVQVWELFLPDFLDCFNQLVLLLRIKPSAEQACKELLLYLIAVNVNV